MFSKKKNNQNYLVNCRSLSFTFIHFIHLFYVKCLVTDSADGLCCKLVSTCVKPRSLIWAMERGKDDEFVTDRNTLHLIKKLGSGQFAEVWLGKFHILFQ